ncbi:MAG: hypothetical protein U0412_02045 [Nitrospira sp.]
MDRSLINLLLGEDGMSETQSLAAASAAPWVRIPDGTKVRLRKDNQEGVIDGLTELVTGPARNPDGRTQYRVNLGDQARTLVVEDDLLVLVDTEGLVLIVKQKVEFRRFVTQRLRGVLSPDRFVRPA